MLQQQQEEEEEEGKADPLGFHQSSLDQSSQKHSRKKEKRKKMNCAHVVTVTPL